MTLHARLALTHKGWAENVRLTIANGRIASLDRAASPESGDVRTGIVIPGLANAHSHAFQRLLAGHTEQRSPAGQDNFWTWRSRMYAFAAAIDAAALRTIARQVYTEMVATGYTAVAEFHYLHSEPGETGTTDVMFEALRDAAVDAGIRLTYVPVLYERAGFGEAGPSPDQRRFALDTDRFLEHYGAARAAARDNVKVAIGVHSLRAVSETSLEKIAQTAARDDVPMHIHIAEQQREVDEAREALGNSPIAWLYDRHDVNARWCLVHATHADAAEIEMMARSGAVVCLCPSTEANLGDGLFPLQPYLEAGGRIAIGSDSHVSINPFEELRWLEYGQRLATQSRNVAAIPRGETGRSLFEAALRGGVQALGQGAAGIEVGAAADLVAMDDDSPMLAGHTTRSLIDAMVFSGFTLPIERVMVGGTWQVIDGEHVNAAAAEQEYVALARKLAEAS